jgi:hypothetical protein
VRVTAAGNVVAISSDERDALLGKIAFVAGCEPIVAKFQAAGATRPIELDDRERNYLRTALDVWEFLSDCQTGWRTCSTRLHRPTRTATSASCPSTRSLSTGRSAAA